MDREYLEDYEQKEFEECDRLVNRRIQEGRFSFDRDRYPPDDRFVKLQEPVALTHPVTTSEYSVWSQVPFSGSLVLLLAPLPKHEFEEVYFGISEIPKVIDFVKDTGRLQIALNAAPRLYEGLDYLDLFFNELNPPLAIAAPISLFGSEKEIWKLSYAFDTLASCGYADHKRQLSKDFDSRIFSIGMLRDLHTYLFLKLGRYTVIEDIENLMIDDPVKAEAMFYAYYTFILVPALTLRSRLSNVTFTQIKASKMLPLVYQPQEIRFPCEIGKFLIKKLTYAPQGLRACNDIIDHYDAYDLQKVQESLNDAIVTNHPDIVNKSAEEFSEILDNVWNDQAVPRQIKNLKRGLPMSIAAIGTAVSAFTGGIEGFLAGLGFSVGAKFLDAEIEGLSEKVVKFFARSYQANVYDFKKKFKDRIVRTQKKEED